MPSLKPSSKVRLVKSKYDPQKRIGIMRSKIGASAAISLGAYAFALSKLDELSNN